MGNDMRTVERTYYVGAGDYRVCRTKCPFHNIMIGTLKCERCKDFARIDRDKLIVYCKRRSI